ncbi:hypothetical protein ABMA27_009225 [Loxostege sticticalis]|uniref:Gustatory receptor n=1 Tax=Loxostege sticticalis TaxID=481309 RepID=A0ABR3HAP8_LOXSC
MKNEGSFPTGDVKEEEKHEATEVVVAVESQPDFVLDEHLKSMLKPINLMQSLFFSTRCIIKNNIILPKTVKVNVWSIIGMVSLICFDINIYHASKIINLLKKQLLLWVTEIEDFSNVSEENLAYNDRKISILKIYFDVITAFDLLKQTFQVMMVYHLLEPFIHGLIYIQFIVEYNENNPNGLYAMGLLMASLMWLVKNVYIQSLLGIECEQYYIVVKDSKVACLKFFNSGRCSGVERRICKNILRTQSLDLHAFHACGLYLVDARLPLQLLSHMATYTIFRLNLYILLFLVANMVVFLLHYRARTLNLQEHPPLINLLKTQLLFWISEVKSLATRPIEDLSFYERRVKLIKAFFDIIEAFNFFKQTFQVMIKSLLMFILLWLTKSVFIHSGLCLECELFYIAVRDSEVACWKILQSGKCTDQERRICKNILRCRQSELDSFRVCRMYLAGAQLPLRLVSLMANCTIVLLQFAFVK